MKTGKTFAIVAVAMIALCSGASAKSNTATISVDGFCDEFTATVKKTAVTAISVSGACESLLGAGFIGNVKKVGEVVNAGVIVGGDSTLVYVAQLSYPFTTGGTISLYYTADGKTMNLVYSTTYTVEGTPARGQRGTQKLSSKLNH
jgi:hypothetical protein